MGGIRVAAYYHATQAVEKYLKALALSIIDPNGTTATALTTRWLRTHNLEVLASRCSGKHAFYGENRIQNLLMKFTEFDQLARYPWTSQTHGNGFTSADTPAFLELVQHLRTDLPIVLDDYLLGMLIRGHHHGHPEHKANRHQMVELSGPVSALRTIFPAVDSIVRR